jgi:cobalt transporter subunit CbtA
MGRAERIQEKSLALFRFECATTKPERIQEKSPALFRFECATTKPERIQEKSPALFRFECATTKRSREMKTFQTLFFAAVLAGLAAGLAMTAIQQWRVAPLILAAEIYEDAGAAAPHDHGAAPADVATAADHHHGDDAAWAPQNGFERTGYTVLADLLAALGFAFLLAAVSLVSGMPVTARNGLVWGLCGWAAFHLAPAFGLPPEMPGMPAAPLVARQVWWWGTALSAALAFFLVARYRTWPAIGVAAVLLLAPQIIGAPPPPEAPSTVPAELATRFAASALTASAVFWLLLGPLYGWLAERLGARAGANREVHA